MKTLPLIAALVLMVEFIPLCGLMAEEYEYRNMFTQHAENESAPDPTLFTQWILDEINNDSMMRSFLREDIAEIEANGRNTNQLTFYYSPEKHYLGRLIFKIEDLNVELTSEKGDGNYEYKATLKTTDNFRGGKFDISYVFSFNIKVEYLKYTEAYSVDASSYPKLVKKNKVETEYPRK
tara:strand:+ start:2312 stop:2848 length:537 start_codon:yes stop_codon:yes gene_type:complete